ncbi:MAG: glutathione S-transferase family protein, partial [Gaiellaceae bacterium]
MRVWRIPYSTNCERVALAAGRSGTPVEWVDVDAVDRTPVRELSGQGRVPVAQIDGEVVVGSLAIVRRVDPTLWPAEPAARAEAEIFLEWLERVWMHPLGVVFSRILGAEVDDARLDRAAARIDHHQDWFESLLDDRDHLLGHELTVADVGAYPFLKYATDRTPGDDYAIHEEMRRLLSVQ